MINKTIAYGWFGGKPKPPLIQHCIDSWSIHCPDYKIIELNEEWVRHYSYIPAPTFVKEAYEQQKWAYVADFYRMYYMYTYGGITLDADVELLSSLDPFLEYNFFSGQEINNKILVTATMGSISRNPMLSMILSYYQIVPFEPVPNTVFLTRIMELFIKTTILTGARAQAIILHNNGVLFPQEVFCPYDHVKRKAIATVNTVAIHHFQGSWKK